MYVYLEWINDLILTVSKVDLGFFFHFRNIHCKFIVNVTILIIYSTKLQEKIGSTE